MSVVGVGESPPGIDAYMSFASATARKISCSESSHNPCLRRTRSAYRVCAQAAMTLCTCNVTDRLLVGLNVTPIILIVCSLGLPVEVVGFYHELKILFFVFGL